MWNGASGARTASASASASRKRLGLEKRAVARRVHVREVDDRPHPAGAAADLDAVLERAEVPHATHHLDPERHRTVLALEPLADDRKLLDDRVDRVLAAACRAGSPDGRRRPRPRRRRRSRRSGRGRRARTTTCARSPRGARPSRTAGHGRKARRRSRGRARRSAPPTDSPSRSPTRSRSRRRRSRARARSRSPPRGSPATGTRAGPTRIRPMRRLYSGGRAPGQTPTTSAAGGPCVSWRIATYGAGRRSTCKSRHVVRRGPYPRSHAADTDRPSRARHRPPPRRTSGARPRRSREWNLEVVSAFMRAAYGKGYCDALTEDAPGSLCLEHGYDVPKRSLHDAAEA